VVTLWKYHRDFDCNFKSRAWTTLKYILQKQDCLFPEIAGSPIIDFNGADNVTLDGRVNQLDPKSEYHQ
jgi:hypothetical protein